MDIHYRSVNCKYCEKDESYLRQERQFPFNIIDESLVDGSLLSLHVQQFAVLLVVEQGLLLFEVLVLCLQLQDDHLQLVPFHSLSDSYLGLFLAGLVVERLSYSLYSCNRVKFLLQQF